MPCLIRQAQEAIGRIKLPAGAEEELFREILGLLSGCDWKASPPAISQQIQRVIRSRAECADPYRDLKRELNRAAWALLPELRRKIPARMSGREAALRLAIAGNLLDAGAKSGLEPEAAVRALAAQVFSNSLAGNWEAVFAKAEAAHRILYLADNAGEIVFYRCLLEALPSGKVTLAVRGMPVLNDATLEDARAAGVDELVPVISNGSDAPGTVLEECSRRFLEVFAASDLIIAKGQGNFETLCAMEKPGFFLFFVKCPVIARRAGAGVGSMVIAPAFPGDSLT